MPLKTTDLTPSIGTRIDTDVATLVSGTASAEIAELVQKRGVVLIRGLRMDDEQQLAFTNTLGPLLSEKSGEVYKVTYDPRHSPQLYFYTPGNFFWHIDRTDSDIPPFITILNAKQLPADGGGDTEFANTYAAYEALPEADKRLIERLRVIHRVADSFRFVPNLSDEQIAAFAAHDPKNHPLVWRHHNGRRSLILSTSGKELEGMGKTEGEALLDRLMAFATQPQFVYRHQWQLGDVVMWDNTGTMHRAMPYAEDSGRLLHRTTVLGEEPFDTERHLVAA
ncbi:MAG: TauD/TfdA dioxygenase family protein [Nevskiales bacterium]